MTDTYDEAVERRARVLCGDGCICEGGPIPKFERCLDRWRDARATLEADDAVGYALVPKEATEAMRDAAINTGLKDLFPPNVRWMINAAIAVGAIRRDER